MKKTGAGPGLGAIMDNKDYRALAMAVALIVKDTDNLVHRAETYAFLIVKFSEGELDASDFDMPKIKEEIETKPSMEAKPE